MHNAPSVTYPVGRSRWVGGVALGICCVGLGLALGMGWQSGTSAGRLAVVAWVCVGAGALAWRGWHHTPQGSLAWDGRTWMWRDTQTSEPGQLEVVLDLQSLMLLRWRGAGQKRWLWLVRSARTAHWADLRRAVYSRARTDVRASANADVTSP